jgi:hypothetical protein
LTTNETLRQLAAEAESLQRGPHDSPEVSPWRERAERFIGREFGASYAELLDEVLDFRFAFISADDKQGMHHAQMGDAVVVLTALQR